MAVVRGKPNACFGGNLLFQIAMAQASIGSMDGVMDAGVPRRLSLELAANNIIYLF